MGWTLRGVYTDLDQDRTLAFTWSWDHEPDVPERTVRVEISHGDYGADDLGDREGHLDGWRFFLGRMAEATGS